MANRHQNKSRSAQVTREAPAQPEVPQPVVRQFTALQWARGRGDALMKAFLAEQKLSRVTKRSAKEWAALYDAWLKKPR